MEAAVALALDGWGDAAPVVFPARRRQGNARLRVRNSLGASVVVGEVCSSGATRLRRSSTASSGELLLWCTE